MREFFQWVTTNFTQIVFANEREIINWIKKPVAYENLAKNSTAFKCKEKATTCANNKTCLFSMTGIEVNMCVN